MNRSMGKQVKRLLILFLLLLTSNFLQSQTTITINPSQDNTLYENATLSISNGKGGYFFSGKTKNGLIRRGLVKFNIAGQVPPGAIINTIRLSLTMDRTITGPQQVSLHVVTRDWGEGGSMASGEEGAGAAAQNGDATWAHAIWPGNPWTKPGGDFNSNTSASIQVDDDGPYHWTSPQMIKDVQRWLDTPSVNFGWCIIGNEASLTTAKQFASRESPIATKRPMLTITYQMLSTRTEQNNALSLISIFPNPSPGRFNLKYHRSSPVSITIYNALGNQVYAQTLPLDQNELDLSSQANGVYGYRIESAQKIVAAGKLMIIH